LYRPLGHLFNNFKSDVHLCPALEDVYTSTMHRRIGQVEHGGLSVHPVSYEKFNCGWYYLIKRKEKKCPEREGKCGLGTGCHVLD
jgi:hypothetical protein